jgi:enterochelin esterase-like enzyme
VQLALERLLLFSFLTVSACVMAAQENKAEAAQTYRLPTPLISPEVHPNGSVTFRFRAPNALQVELALEGAEPAPMRKDKDKDGDGLWSITMPTLAPDYYGYSFVADGVRLIDPSNPLLQPNILDTGNMVHVPGPSSLPWEVNDVPHGEIHHHFYASAVAADFRDYYVYTPPDYERSGRRKYPILYLLHGFSDDASAWTAVGHMNVILDNLISQGKAKPMIVVMPLGYGTMEFVRMAWDAWSHAELRDQNFKKFSEALLTEVIPRVESEYRVNKHRDDRAIAGLSMGGSESLLVGLNHLDKFSWVGGFSSGGIPEDFKNDFPSLDAHANQQLHLLWIACGTEDDLITTNRALWAWLKTQGINVTEVETPGMHTWMVWRRNLAEFAPLLFR